MEPEAVRSEIEETFPAKESYPIAPVSYLNHIQMINTKNIAKIGVSQIKTLSQRTFPNDVFPQIKDFSDNQIQELTEKLLSINNTKFLEVLCTVIFMCSDEGIDILKQCGVSINVEHQGETVVLAYIRHTDEFEVALNRLLFISTTTDKTYHIFKPKVQVPKIEEPKNTIQDIENEFKEYFESSNYGKFCRLRLLYPVKGDNRLGFFIEHGSNLKSKIVIDSQDEVSPFCGRNLIGDCLIYDPSLKLVLISSKSVRHCRFYAEMMGKIFWNNKTLFNTQALLDLSFIKRANAQLLESCQTENIVVVQLKTIHSAVDDANNLRTVKSIGRGCLIRNAEKFIIEENITKVTMALKLNLNGRNRLQRLILKPTSIRCGFLVSQASIQHIFNQLRLINEGS